VSVILNCILDLLITFVELNKFDAKLISVLTAPLKKTEIERRNSYTDSNDTKMYKEIDLEEKSLESCYSSLLSYIMKLFVYFILFVSPNPPPTTSTSTTISSTVK
jgi:hypothetical protein